MRPPHYRFTVTLGTTLFAIAGWAFLSSFAVKSTPAPTMEELRSSAGTIHLPAGDRCLSVQGEATYRGTDAHYEMQLSADGSFRYAIDGPLTTLVTSDGRQVWQRDAGSAVFELELLMKEALRLGVWFESGYWLAPEAPIVISEPVGKGADSHVTVRTKAGLLDADVTLDRQTHQPVHVDLSNFAVDAAIDYSDYKSVGGLGIPHRIRMTDETGGVDEFRVQRAVTATCPSKELSSMPQGIDDTTFDPQRSSRLKVRRIGTGHMAVKPVINGKPTGWFVFDSGAGISVITPAAAKRLGLKKIGESVLAGSGADVAKGSLYGLDSFQLGPMTMRDGVFLEMDIDTAVPSLRGIEGVIGWDILIRARVEMDLAGPALSLYDSSGEHAVDYEWQPLGLHGKHPHVRGSFAGDHTGLFSLDTGAANTTVVFYSPVVEKFSLLDKRYGRTQTFNGAGGRSRYVMGRLDWVEIGGHRYEDLPVRLSLDNAGAMADPYGLGNVGVNILRDYRLVFDYPNRRIALAER